MLIKFFRSLTLNGMEADWISHHPMVNGTRDEDAPMAQLLLESCDSTKADVNDRDAERMVGLMILFASLCIFRLRFRGLTGPL